MCVGMRNRDRFTLSTPLEKCLGGFMVLQGMEDRMKTEDKTDSITECVAATIDCSLIVCKLTV